jgi:hypothetical protein
MGDGILMDDSDVESSRNPRDKEEEAFSIFDYTHVTQFITKDGER